MASQKIPSTTKKLVATRSSTKFRDIVEVVSIPTPQPGDGELLVKNRYVGINASDINFSAGRYFPVTEYPLDLGFEAIGEVVAAGANAKYKPGQAVMFLQFGAFREYIIVKADKVVPLPSLKPEFLAFMLSGNTASISLDKIGHLKESDTVLVTAAAGGTGQIAVQWAKLRGCHVIGTCSTDDKVQFLKDLGCDRPINYKKENLGEVLKKEYPNGVDVVYETIGGDMFDTCVENLAKMGRIVIIGYITKYDSDGKYDPPKSMATLPSTLLGKSASVGGFFLLNHAADCGVYAMKQVTYYNEGKLKSFVDLGDRTEGGRFKGIEKITDAIEYLYSKRSIGKIMVELN